MSLYAYEEARKAKLQDLANDPTVPYYLRIQANDEISAIIKAAQQREVEAAAAKGTETFERTEDGRILITWTPDEYEQNPTRTEGE